MDQENLNVVEEGKEEKEKEDEDKSSLPSWIVPAAVGVTLCAVVAITVVTVRRKRHRELNRMKYSISEDDYDEESILVYEQESLFTRMTISMKTSVQGLFRGIFGLREEQENAELKSSSEDFISFDESEEIYQVITSDDSEDSLEL